MVHHPSPPSSALDRCHLHQKHLSVVLTASGRPCPLVPYTPVIEGRPPRRLQVLFHSLPDDGFVVVITIGIYAVAMTHVIVVIFLHSLVALVTTTPHGTTRVPWETWGPRFPACFECPVRPKFDVLIGDRLAILLSETGSFFDFNSTRIQDAIQMTGNSSANCVHVATAKHRSVVSRGSVFREDVVGELPYISVVRPAPTD